MKSQRLSRGQKARGQGQGHKKNPRPGQPFREQTLSRPRTGMLEAKVKDQGHKRKCSQKKKKKKVFTKIFQAISKKKRSSQKIFRQSQKKKRSSQKIFKQSPRKKRFPKNFSSASQNFMLSSSRGQANFRGLEASRPRPRT